MGSDEEGVEVAGSGGRATVRIPRWSRRSRSDRLETPRRAARTVLGLWRRRSLRSERRWRRRWEAAGSGGRATVRTPRWSRRSRSVPGGRGGRAASPVVEEVAQRPSRDPWPCCRDCARASAASWLRSERRWRARWLGLAVGLRSASPGGRGGRAATVTRPLAVLPELSAGFGSVAGLVPNGQRRGRRRGGWVRRSGCGPRRHFGCSWRRRFSTPHGSSFPCPQAGFRRAIVSEVGGRIQSWISGPSPARQHLCCRG
ncbi:hypothetical protein FBY23_4530 [Nocardioides sp. SLBN-35]|nr:hypothetical protein FBY23_4530 [Nocardioides sp. SLBN-35]